jgi:hypothetical protein
VCHFRLKSLNSNSFLYFKQFSLMTNLIYKRKTQGKTVIVVRESKISLSYYPRLSYLNQTSNSFIESAREVLVCIGIAIFCIVSYSNTIPSLIAREKKSTEISRNRIELAKSMNLPHPFLFIQIFRLDSIRSFNSN